VGSGTPRFTNQARPPWSKPEGGRKGEREGGREGGREEESVQEGKQGSGPEEGRLGL
jgi:hypothetical protein